MTELRDETLLGTLETGQRTMKPNALFYLWFGSNLTVADFALGVLVESYGLTVYYTILALLIANIFGGLLVAFMSHLGPTSGMGQMEISKNLLERGWKNIFSASVYEYNWLVVRKSYYIIKSTSVYSQFTGLL